MNIITISNEDLDNAENSVKDDDKYGRESILINSALKQYPSNNDMATVAMKISLIDLTNGTNLSRNLGKKGGIYDLALKITEVNFDKRVAEGDLDLVNELSKWTKEKFEKNLFSFITKYCLYHNVHCYNRDNFVIYDSILVNNLYKYITKEDFKNITGKKLSKSSIKKFKDNFQYEEYKKVIDFIIEKNQITTERKHRKFDWFIWYKYRSNLK